MKLLYIKAIAVAAKKVKVSFPLLLSICITESNLKNVPNVNDRNKGSHGICQINAIHHRSISNLYDPYFNSLMAANILKSNLNKYKDIWVSVSAYSTGNNRWFNAEYVKKVKSNYYSLRCKGGLVCLKKTGMRDSNIQR